MSRWCIEPKVLGGAMLAAGPALMQLVGNKWSWWAGLAFTTIGPILLAMKRRNCKKDHHD